MNFTALRGAQALQVDAGRVAPGLRRLGLFQHFHPQAWPYPRAMPHANRYSPDVPDIHRPYTAADDRYQARKSRQVGKSGMFLPPISLGLWWNFGDNIALDNQRALLRHAFDKGTYHFDLANNYGPQQDPPRKTLAASSPKTSSPTATN